MRSVLSVLFGVAWLLAAAPGLSHHSFAAVFDVSRPIDITGTVTRIDWTNPHAWIHLDVEDQSKVRSVDDGSPANVAGIRPGDVIRTMDGQRVLTFADASRVLELAPETGELQFGHRYSSDLQVFLILLTWLGMGTRITRPALALLALSVAMNAAGAHWFVSTYAQ